MRITRLVDMAIVLLLLSSFLFMTGVTIADDVIENKVDASFEVVFESATDFDVSVTLDVRQITLEGSGKTYTGEEIEAVASTD